MSASLIVTPKRGKSFELLHVQRAKVTVGFPFRAREWMVLSEELDKGFEHFRRQSRGILLG
jgi:hypothetical protein